MEQYKGNSISKGIAVGKLYFYRKSSQKINIYKVNDIEAESRRFESAKALAVLQLKELYEVARREVGVNDAEIFRAQAMILNDEEYVGLISNLIQQESAAAEYAVAAARDKFAALFEEKDEFFQARMEDIKDVSGRILQNLLEERVTHLPEQPVIILADEMTPGELISLGKDKVSALVTRHTSQLSHTAILTRMMKIPVLTGMDIQESWNGKTAIVDGENGVLIIEPDYSICEKYKKENSGENIIIEDVQKVKVCANIADVTDAKEAWENGADGIGLFRTEFMYLGKGSYPTEEEQYQAYTKIAKEMQGKRTVIRTFDIREDKQIANCHQADEAEVLHTQIRAIYRAASTERIAILFPMISTKKELEDIKEICREVKAELIGSGVKYAEPELGIMIETPQAVQNSEQLAREADFISIGTNDLLRTFPEKDRCYEEISDMIQKVICNAHTHGCKVSVCGELAADITLTETFLKMRTDELSVAPHMVPVLKNKVRKREEI